MLEGLRRIWKQAKKDMISKAFIEAELKDNHVVRFDCIVQNVHKNTLVNISQNMYACIDTEIAALVAEMNRVGIKTTCSCQGDTEQDGAYISIKVGEGTTYDYRDDTKELTLRWVRS